MKRKKEASIIASNTVDSERKIFIATSDASLHQYTWDQKLQYGPNIRNIRCPFQFSLPTSQVIEALRENSTVTSISFINRPWNQKELNDLVECLTEYNRGITIIEFEGMAVTSIIAEAFVKIFKRNPRIKTVKFSQYFNGIPNEFFARFCDGLEYYHIESLELDIVKSPEQFRILSEGLKHNQSLTELSIKQQTLTDAKLFTEICNGLQASPTISSFRFATNGNDLSQEDYRALSEVILNKKLKHLTLKANRIEFGYLADALKKSTSIQSLQFASQQANYGFIGEILRTNSHIKKLHIDRSSMDEKSVLDLGLSTNTSLEELSIDSSALTGETLFLELQQNSTLKSLTFAHSLVFDVVGLQELLKINTSLTELNLPVEIFSDNHACRYLANGLINNTTLRKLTCKLGYQDHSAVMKFLQDMKHNTSLTHLSMGPEPMRLGMLNRYGAAEFSRLDLVILDLVNTNKSLRFIEGADEFPQIAEKLKENRLEQDIIIKNMCTWIKMILMKPNSFILPIEVWSNIFKYTSYSSVPFDFEKFFKDSMA